MECKRCGAEINDHAKFCENCGARISENLSGGHDDIAEKQAKKKNVRKEENYNEPDGKKKGSTAVIVLLCILIGIMLFVVAAVGSYMFIDNHSSVLKDSYKEQNNAADATMIPITPMPEETKAPTAKPTQAPKRNTDIEHISNPSYNVYSDTEMGFSCAYPTHFDKYNDNTNEGRYTLRNEDASVSLRICAEENSSDITLAQSMSMFKTKNPGEIEYSKTGNTYYAIRINDNGICRYRYLESKNGKMYWFDFNYPEEYRDIYEGYIDHIYRSFTVR